MVMRRKKKLKGVFNFSHGFVLFRFLATHLAIMVGNYTKAFSRAASTTKNVVLGKLAKQISGWKG